jgi:hypothetical protein
MPSTILLSATENWASAFANFEPLNIATANEPTITNANTILQTIVGPPFKWNWNRSPFGTITTVAGTQDYPLSIANFGFLEGASVTSGGSTIAIKEVKQELTVGTEPGRPQSIAPQIDNNYGTITFRFLPVPDNVYTIVPYGQNSPTLFTSLSQSWAPIPDKLEYLYNWGFVALSLAYSDDQRFPIFNQKFIAHLLGAQQGLSETERNMFLDSWNILTNQNSIANMKAQQGRQAIGAF